MKTFRIFFLFAVVSILQPAFANDRESQKKEMEEFMHEYLRLWNAHDAATITARIYRLEGNHAWQSKDVLQAEFDRLKGQGYLRSEIASVIGCPTGPDAGQVELRFTRIKSDGTFMPPKDRISLYRLKRFADGWRVIGLQALNAGQKMECPGK